MASSEVVQKPNFAVFSRHFLASTALKTHRNPAKKLSDGFQLIDYKSLVSNATLQNPVCITGGLEDLRGALCRERFSNA